MEILLLQIMRPARLIPLPKQLSGRVFHEAKDLKPCRGFSLRTMRFPNFGASFAAAKQYAGTPPRRFSHNRAWPAGEACNADHNPWSCVPGFDSYRSVAFAVLAFAAALEAFTALARRSSALNFSARAYPPMRPSALVATDNCVALRLLVIYLLGVFRFMRTFYSVRYGEASLNKGQIIVFMLTGA